MTDGNFNLFYKVTSIKILRTFNLEINRINKTVDKNKNKNTQLCHFKHIPVFQLNHIFNHFQELYTNFQQVCYFPQDMFWSSFLSSRIFLLIVVKYVFQSSILYIHEKQIDCDFNANSIFIQSDNFIKLLLSLTVEFILMLM